jgi:hypothetical protein
LIRNAARLVLAGCVALALSLGTTATVQASAPGSDTSRAAAPCAKQKSKVAKAKKAVHQAQKKVKKAKKAKQHADGKKQKRAADKKLAKAKKQLKAKKKALKKAKAKLAKCQRNQSPPPADNPLQPACDAGLPQEICDAYATLPTPPPGADSPIQPLCDAGLPQPICDAAANPPGPGGASPIQPLCDAGLPQAICDAASGGGELPSDPGTVIDQVCGLLPIPGLCDGTLPLPLRATRAA